MKKYKVCIYAICKNESKFIKRWYESIKGADYICVLDTGSEDDSLEILKKLNIKVKQKIISHKNVVNNRLTKAFPNLTFKDNNIEFLTIKEIKRKLKESKEKNKKSNTPES